MNLPFFLTCYILYQYFTEIDCTVLYVSNAIFCTVLYCIYAQLFRLLPICILTYCEMQQNRRSRPFFQNGTYIITTVCNNWCSITIFSITKMAAGYQTHLYNFGDHTFNGDRAQGYSQW